MPPAWGFKEAKDLVDERPQDPSKKACPRLRLRSLRRSSKTAGAKVEVKA